jgi:hypothetical protein
MTYKFVDRKIQIRSIRMWVVSTYCSRYEHASYPHLNEEASVYTNSREI